MGAPQKPYANITKSFVHLAAQICFMKNCWNPSPMTAITGPCTRHYHPTLSIWLSVDPMSDKYPGVSPYTYCANNPVRLVDPDGREVYIFGDQAREAFASLQNNTSLELSINAEGKVTIVGGEAQNRNDVKLAKAINSTKIRVEIYADKSNNDNETGGAYMGTSYFKETKSAESCNHINMEKLVRDYKLVVFIGTI